MDNGDAAPPPVGPDAYQAAFWHAPDGVLIVVPGGPVLAANPAACGLLGRDEAELRTMTRQQLVDPDDDRWRAITEERDRTGSAAGTARLRRRGGGTFEAEITAARFTDGPSGEPRACLVVRDVTRRTAIVRRLAALNELNRALLAGDGRDRVLRHLAGAARTLVRSRWGLVVGVAGDPAKIEVLAAVGPGTEGLEGRTFDTAGTPSGRVMAEGAPARFDDLTGPTSPYRYASLLEAGPTLIAPIMEGEHRYGTVVAANEPGGPAFGPGDLDLVTEFAHYAATALAVGDAREEAERDLHAALRAEQAASRQLSARNARLLELDEARTQVLATVAHELRTPLTAIASFTELLQEDDVAPDRGSYLAAIARNSQRLLRLVGDVLVLSELSSETLHLETTEFSVASLLEEAARAVAPAAERAGVVVVVEAGGGPPLVGDYERLLQLLSNLLVNAVKYSPTDATVRVLAGHEPGRWILTVRDQGIGIPADELAQVGERFFRASNARSRRAEGTGLGLSIARAITDRHRGTLAVSSVEGRGTTVTVSLPDRP